MRRSGAASCFSSQAPGTSRSMEASSQRRSCRLHAVRRRRDATILINDERYPRSLLRCARFTPRLATFEGRITVISYVSCICLTVSGIVDEDQPRTVRQRCSTIGCMAQHIDHCRIPRQNDRFTDRAITASHQVADGVHSAIIRATKPTPPGAERCRPSIRPIRPRSVTSVASRARWWSHPGHHTAPR